MRQTADQPRCLRYCCAGLAVISTITVRLIPVELLSLIYAIWVFLRTEDMWLCLAKYHGFAINICLILLLIPLLRNLQCVIVNCRAGSMRFIRAIYQRLHVTHAIIRCYVNSRPQRYMHSHEFYSYRLLFSAVLHTLVHVLRTHPFNLGEFACFFKTYQGTFSRLFGKGVAVANQTTVSKHENLSRFPEFTTDEHTVYNGENRLDTAFTLPVNLTSLTNTSAPVSYVVDYPEALIVYDRWTVTGYLLLFFFIVEWLLGMRLVRFLVKHAYVLLIHRIVGTVIIILFLSPHHRNYTFIALPALLFILDYFIGVYLLTYSTQVRRVVIYPGITSVSPATNTYHRDEVLEIDFDVISDRFVSTCKPGDYIAVKIPQISRWQWHHFTVMTYNDCGYGYDIGSGRYTLHGVAIVRRKIIVRCVGKWTRAILHHRSNNNLRMAIKGPYHTDQGRIITDLLSKSADRLVFMSTGTAITHHLSILNGLIDEYWLRETTTAASGRFNACPASCHLPNEIRLVWIIRHSTDVNFAITALNDTQLLLSKRGMDGLLTYDIWITREPTLNERELNTRLQSYLSATALKGEACHNTADVKAINGQPDAIRLNRRNQIVSLQHGLTGVRRQFARSLTHPFHRHMDNPLPTSAELFDLFYTNTQMHTGVRPSWNKLRSMCTINEDIKNTVDSSVTFPSIADAKDYPFISPASPRKIAIPIDRRPTLVLLNTSVERLRLDVEQLAASHGFELLVEGLWS